MPALQVEVRRHSTPQVEPPPISDRFGQVLSTISGFAFRFNVMQDLDNDPDGEAQQPIEIISVIPTIEDAAAALIKITLTLAHTGFPPGQYRGELIWRTDGTDPVFPDAPDDFTPVQFTITEEAEAVA